MFDKGADKTCCDDLNNAKFQVPFKYASSCYDQNVLFQPLELLFRESLFYCYFERVAERGLWFFFIRIVGNQEQASMFRSIISVGHAGM